MNGYTTLIACSRCNNGVRPLETWACHSCGNTVCKDCWNPITYNCRKCDKERRTERG